MRREYNVYLSGMAKGLEDKLFFLDHLDLHDFERVIDFGCGGGQILRALRDTHLRLIGVDHDEYMREVARNTIPRAEIYETLTRDMITPRTLVIFSSVLHEVEDYWKQLAQILRGTGCTVVVRDMRYTAPEEPVHSLTLAKLVRYANNIHLSQFIKRWGLATQKDAYHFLLKYSYVDNWSLELEENYFGFDYQQLFNLGTVVYEENFVLPFKLEQVFADFGIDLRNPTHTKLIIKIACQE